MGAVSNQQIYDLLLEIARDVGYLNPTLRKLRGPG
jgi:hypothetical protein